jgi:endonuclease-3
LQALAGSRRKTADNVAPNTAFGQPTMAVDTHIFRVSNRIGLTHANNVEQSERQVAGDSSRPPDSPNAHHWLILHGRYRARRASRKCDRCPIIRWCVLSR